MAEKAAVANWQSKVVRLEVDRSNSDDLNERIGHAIDAEKVDGWTPVGAISAWNSWGLYIVFEKQEQLNG